MTALRSVTLGDLNTVKQTRSDGSIVLRARAALDPYPRTMLDRLHHWAEREPERAFISQRDRSNRERWVTLSYAQTLDSVRRVASGLLKFPLSAEHPIAILSGNDIEHALLALAAMYIGVPYAPISAQYSLLSEDHAKLKYVLDLITPGLVFVSDGDLYGRALANAVSDECPLIVVKNPLSNRRCVSFDDLKNSEIDPCIEERFQRIDGDTIAKFLFSSGSTGMPKAVINTHRMLCANQQMIIQALPCLADPPPVLLDWLPWNHTFGGNHNLGIALYNGGSYYIDEGKPTPQGFLESVRNLKEIAPTAFYNVPKGFEELVKHLRNDSQLRENFFSRLSMLFYAGAGLSQPVWDALEEIALDTCGERILIVTGLGSTETSPSALFTTGDGGFAGWLGLPIPGVEAKLVKVGDKTEIRFRGDNVTPGYWRNPEQTAKAFDEEGFFCSGDAVRFVDESDPQRGLVFDGRISEDFKLDTGTWVSTGPLRARFLNHFGSLVKDVVIVGRDRPSVGALIFPDLEQCQQLTGLKADASPEAVLSHPVLHQRLRDLLDSLAAQATGSASRIDRLALQLQAPSMDNNEITDKGSLNAGAIQDRRAACIEALYRGDPDPLSIYLNPQRVQRSASVSN